MIDRALFTCALLLAGCGGPAIVGASQHIAALRGCAAPLLTVQPTAGGYVAAGCGDTSGYECDDDGCRPSDAPVDVDATRVREVRSQLAELDADLTACAGGAAPAVQVLVDAVGHPQGLALEPAADAEVRACVGRLVLEHVSVSSGDELLVSYPAPAPPEGDEAGTEPMAEPTSGASTTEPQDRAGAEPADEPEDRADDDEPGAAEPADEEEAEPADGEPAGEAPPPEG